MPEAPAGTARVRAVEVSFGARSDVGLRRSVNEDAILGAPPVFLVADGMGGHEAGDRASAAVIEAFRPLVGRTDIVASDVVSAVAAANRTVQELAAGLQRGAGSTLTGLVLLEHEGVPHWLVVNIGDSRVYRIINTDLQQLTIDHSLAQELVDRGELGRDDVAKFAKRNVITRAVGAEDYTADYWVRPVVTGERLLVCSDGLSGELNDEAIRAGLTMGGTTQQTADALLARALAAGGRDNVSVLVIDVVAGGLRPSSELSTSSLFGTNSETVESRRNHDTIELPGRGARRVRS
jgi:serine/threonine protein phosphatase PrpC